MRILILALLGLSVAAGATTGQPSARPTAERQAQLDAAAAAARAGEINLRRRRPAEALADFDRAISLLPEWGLAHAFRALALTELRRDDEARTAMALALRLGGADPIVHQHEGYMHLMMGEFAASVHAYSRALELQPNNTEALDRRAQAYTSLGQMDLALADLDRIIAVEPADPNAYFQRARILVNLGRQADALSAIDRAVTVDSRDYYYLSWKGDLLDWLGRREEAAAAHRGGLARLEARVAAMPAGRPASWVMETRLNLLGRSGRHAEAIALAERELGRTPDAPAMLAARCWLRMEANIDLTQALHDCDRALAAQPNHPVAAAARARLYLRMERWAEAESAFNDLIYYATGRSESNALYGRGLARIRRGDTAQGQRDLREARRRKFDVAWEFARIGLDLAAAPPAAN